MNDEYRWQQLGTAINSVLADAKRQAVRNGSISKTASLGFLDPCASRQGGSPQLELPFNMKTDPAQSSFGTPSAPKGVRLI